MLSSVEQAFVERDEKRAPLKTTAWEAIVVPDLVSVVLSIYSFQFTLFSHDAANLYTGKSVLSGQPWETRKCLL